MYKKLFIRNFYDKMRVILVKENITIKKNKNLKDSCCYSFCCCSKDRRKKQKNILLKYKFINYYNKNCLSSN